MSEENKDLIYNGKCIFIEARCRGKVNERERPMTKEERMKLLVNHKVETDEDLQKLGILFSEDE